jgi:hypothetical protein
MSSKIEIAVRMLVHEPPVHKLYEIDWESARRMLEAISNLSFLTDYKLALATAAQYNTHVLAVFSGYSWCPHCMHLRDEVFKTFTFGLWAIHNNLVLLDLDFPASGVPPALTRLQQKYNVRGFPTALCLDPDGSDQGRVVGYAAGTGAASWIAEFEAQTQLNSTPAKL